MVILVPSSTTRPGISLKYSAVAGLLRCIQRNNSLRHVNNPGFAARVMVLLPRKKVVYSESNSTGPGGVWVCRADGTLLGRILLPELPANLACGEDGSVLFLTARTSVYRIQSRTRGALLG